jgi:hypothetical protein
MGWNDFDFVAGRLRRALLPDDEVGRTRRGARWASAGRPEGRRASHAGFEDRLADEGRVRGVSTQVGGCRRLGSSGVKVTSAALRRVRRRRKVVACTFGSNPRARVNSSLGERLQGGPTEVKVSSAQDTMDRAKSPLARDDRREEDRRPPGLFRLDGPPRPL